MQGEGGGTWCVCVWEGGGARGVWEVQDDGGGACGVCGGEGGGTWCVGGCKVRGRGTRWVRCVQDEGRGHSLGHRV